MRQEGNVERMRVVARHTTDPKRYKKRYQALSRAAEATCFQLHCYLKEMDRFRVIEK